MSTATVIMDINTGLPVVTFNRDALPSTFAQEQRPMRVQLGRHQVATVVLQDDAPNQAVFGTNQYGLTVWSFQRQATGEARPPDASPYQELVPLVLQCGSLHQVRARLAATPLNKYAPHRLFVMDTTGCVHVYTGQGMHDPDYTVLNPQRFKAGSRVWASCSWSDRLANPRKALFHEWMRDGLEAIPRRMLEFHANTEDAKQGTGLAGCGQVFVRRAADGPGRPAAVTGSICQVVYTPKGMRFAYWKTWDGTDQRSPLDRDPYQRMLPRGE